MNTRSPFPVSQLYSHPLHEQQTTHPPVFTFNVTKYVLSPGAANVVIGNPYTPILSADDEHDDEHDDDEASSALAHRAHNIRPYRHNSSSQQRHKQHSLGGRWVDTTQKVPQRTSTRAAAGLA